MAKFIDNVDPFIGLDNEGQCLCGPYLPFSLVRLGPDTLPPQGTSGYASDKPITGFSHTHVSGTGGLGRYGNIRITPMAGEPRLGISGYGKREEKAKAGYYSVVLEPDGIRAELASTERTGAHRYTFPEGARSLLLVDAGAVVQPFKGPLDYNGTAPVSIGGFIEKISSTEIVGRGDLAGGWGHGYPYSVYFYLRADKPFESCQAGNAGGFVSACDVQGPNSKAVLDFGRQRSVELRVGISYVSIANARASVDRESGSLSFEQIAGRSEKIWENMLSHIEVQGGSTDQRKLFYTLFTRLVCMPSDLGIDDEFDRWKSGVRHFTDFYCLWDSVRNANSLIGLMMPQMEAALLNCLLDIGEKTGWIPDAWIAGHRAFMQGGSSADILFAEAALKGIEGIDYPRALAQIRKNNEVEPENPYFQGRYLKHYRDLGYVSTDTRLSCVSRHLEYAYQDWCIGTLAEKIGDLKTAKAFKASSKKVWNLWRDDLRHFAPKRPDGSWVEPFDVDTHLIPDRWNDPYFYEGTSRQWSFNVQHDFAGLVARHGGKDAFVRHLDAFFDGGHYHSKETMVHVPYLYHYAGKPHLSQDRVRRCMETYFAPTRDGLLDNDDAGCQSAFYMCSALGLYPLMGQDIYWLIAPVFDRAKIRLAETGKSLTIETVRQTPQSKYIVSAKLNGRPLENAWIRHGQIAEGATLEYTLGEHPAQWGATPPPSPLSEQPA